MCPTSGSDPSTGEGGEGTIEPVWVPHVVNVFPWIGSATMVSPNAGFGSRSRSGALQNQASMEEIVMKIDTRRLYFNKIATMMAAVTGAPIVFAQRLSTGTLSTSSPGDQSRRSNHTHNGVYYFSGTGSNDGYPKEDHVLVTDPFEKHVTRTMDALKKSVERAGCTMDSIIHLEVFLCLPHADTVPMPTGKARFDAHKAQYDALNKIYGTYFSTGKTPSRACMAVEWIPGDSLIEIVGSALVVSPT
jgi:enamine deaminase RidA (YjgF/YER057c/UK114 family)